MRARDKQARAALDEIDRLPFPTPAGVSVATFGGFDADGHFQVTLSDAADPMIALSTIGLAGEDVGARVVVAYEEGNAGRLIIIGRLREQAEPQRTVVKVDGQRLLLRAAQSIELRCGEASITLTAAGKVLIRGTFVVSRSSGANKIKGAFVDIN